MPFAFLRRLRTLAVLLAVLIPVKTLAAVVLQITGMPGHRHAAQAIGAEQHHLSPIAHHATHETEAPAHALPHCAALAVELTDPTGLHEHACPHLGMASICAAVAAVYAGNTSIRATDLDPVAPLSVVLDVPRPPPTI